MDRQLFTDCSYDIVLNCRQVSEGTLKDPQRVLRQKDLDLERVRKEIQALSVHYISHPGVM
jgi:hypothetical protein